MAVVLSKTNDEIQQLPLVELAFEILKTTKEPLYFRDLMNEVQTLRTLTQEQVNDVIARLYTEINVDGRFLCIGQNVWGLKRWYPVDKVAEKSGKKFIRATGDAFSEDDEDLDDYEDLTVDDEEPLALFADDDVADDTEAEEEFVVEEEEEEDAAFDGDDAEPAFEEESEEDLVSEDADEESDDEEEHS